MTTSEIEELARLLDGRLAAHEARITRVVNERTTNVIDATTAIVLGVQEDVHAVGQAVDDLRAHVLARVSRLEDGQAALRADVDALAEAQQVELPSRTEAPSLREQIAAVGELATRRLLIAAAFFVLIELAQWVFLAFILAQRGL